MITWQALEAERLYAYKVALVKTRNVDKAHEFAQMAVVKAWEKRSSFKGQCSVRTWMERIVINAILDDARRLRNTEVPLGAIHSLTSPEHEYEPLSREDRAWSAAGDGLRERIVQAAIERLS